VPRWRSDVFLPIVTPWEDGDVKVAAVQRAYDSLPAMWDAAAEDREVDATDVVLAAGHTTGR